MLRVLAIGMVCVGCGCSCLYSYFLVVVLVVCFGGLWGVVVWVWVWYGCPVLGSYRAAMAIALSACLRACCMLRGVGIEVSAPRAYGAPVPRA